MRMCVIHRGNERCYWMHIWDFKEATSLPSEYSAQQTAKFVHYHSCSRSSSQYRFIVDWSEARQWRWVVPDASGHARRRALINRFLLLLRNRTYAVFLNVSRALGLFVPPSRRWVSFLEETIAINRIAQRLKGDVNYQSHYFEELRVFHHHPFFS